MHLATLLLRNSCDGRPLKTACVVQPFAAHLDHLVFPLKHPAIKDHCITGDGCRHVQHEMMLWLERFRTVRLAKEAHVLADGGT